jgi:hypothetical protein
MNGSLIVVVQVETQGVALGPEAVLLSLWDSGIIHQRTAGRYEACAHQLGGLKETQIVVLTVVLFRTNPKGGTCKRSYCVEFS